MVKDKKNSDLIIIPKGTPCVLNEEITSSIGKPMLVVNFEEIGSKNLVFGNDLQEDGGYYLMAKEWQNKVGKVKYGIKNI